MPGFQHFLRRLEQFYGQLNLPEKSEELTRIAGTITATDFIDVAVVGQFKAGKSSFINSILGEAVIPTGFLPVTSVITRVCFCSEQYNPGMGSISEETTQVTTRWLTEASFALLITKIDLVPSEEHTRLIEYIRNGISTYSTDYPDQKPTLRNLIWK